MIGGIVAIILSYLELNVVIVIISSILSIIIFQLVI
jgi:branched-subunit amino acid transport protein